MLNAGVMNDTIIPGYGVTKFPVNTYAFNMLPDGTTRNFGLSTQYVQYNNPMMTPLERFLARDITNPNHISQWDPMLFSLGCPQMSQYNTMTNPFLTQMGLMSAANMGWQMGMQNRINSMIQNIARSLGSLESQLTSLINNNQLTDKQKAKLEAKLEEVQELKEKIEDFLGCGQPTLEDLQAISGEVIELQKSISKVIKEITKEVQNSNNDDDDDVDNDDDSDNDSDDNDTKVNCDKKGRPTSLGAAPSEREVDMICAQVRNSLVCAGTNHDVLDPIISSLNAGNIVEVIKHWEAGYGQHTSNGNEGFFAKIFDDVGDDWQSQFVPMMLDALAQRAEALGIYDEVKADIAAVNKGLATGPSLKKLWCGGWQDDHQLANSLMAIYDKIVAKEKANADEVSGKSDKAKADKKQKADNEAKEAKATFLADMREIWDDEELQISDKVQYKDGKFTVRIQGENYSATSFKALVKKIEKDDLDPKKYLAKQKVNVKA